MSDSILTSTKKVLGITEQYTAFDVDILMHINSAFATLNQLGLGPEAGFAITDAVPTWNDFLGEFPDPRLNSIKTYVYLKVRLTFDPPVTAHLLESIKEQIRELEWRLNVHRESTDWTSPYLVLEGGVMIKPVTSLQLRSSE